jgi:N-acetylmuramoyl-L-alanine amidase
MRVIGDAERTRFVVDLERSPDFGVRRLANPYRVVIDIPEVEFPAPSGPGEGRGLVTEYRYGMIAPGRGRIVLDLTSPADIVNSFVLDPVAPEPARLVIDLAPTTAESFDADVVGRSPTVAAVPAVPPPPAIPSRHPVVVIDAGHGGIDSGAAADGLLEKDVTLRFALALAAALEEGGAVEPVLTREEDVFLSLAERVEVARRHHATLFISVHADTVREDYVRGATVYTLSEDASRRLPPARTGRTPLPGSRSRTSPTTSPTSSST